MDRFLARCSRRLSAAQASSRGSVENRGRHRPGPGLDAVPHRVVAETVRRVDADRVGQREVRRQNVETPARVPRQTVRVGIDESQACLREPQDPNSLKDANGGRFDALTRSATPRVVL